MLSQQQRIVGSTSKRVKNMAGHVTQRVESGPYHSSLGYLHWALSRGPCYFESHLVLCCLDARLAYPCMKHQARQEGGSAL